MKYLQGKIYIFRMLCDMILNIIYDFTGVYVKIRDYQLYPPKKCSEIEEVGQFAIKRLHDVSFFPPFFSLFHRFASPPHTPQNLSFSPQQPYALTQCLINQAIPPLFNYICASARHHCAFLCGAFEMRDDRLLPYACAVQKILDVLVLQALSGAEEGEGSSPIKFSAMSLFSAVDPTKKFVI